MVTLSFDMSAVIEAVEELRDLFGDGTGVSQHITARVAAMLAFGTHAEVEADHGWLVAVPSPELLAVLASLRASRGDGSGLPALPGSP